MKDIGVVHVMSKLIRIKDIVDGMEIQVEGLNTYLNVSTGEIITVSADDLRAAEDEEPFGDLPEWQQEDRKTAIKVIEQYENFKELPTPFDINEYNMMEQYCFLVKDEKKRNMVYNSLKGKGAFRRFKDQVENLELEDEWYKFRDEQYQKIAINWCKNGNIQFVEREPER